MDLGAGVTEFEPQAQPFTANVILGLLFNPVSLTCEMEG